MGYFPGVTLGMSGKFVGDSHDAETTEASERSPPGEVFSELRLVTPCAARRCSPRGALRGRGSLARVASMA